MNGKMSLRIFSCFSVLLLCLGSHLSNTDGRAQERSHESAMSKASARAPLAAVISTDCGVEMDDQWALTHLLLSPEIDLKAIISSHASSIGFSSATSAQKAAEVVAHVIPAGAPSRPPVMRGSDSPLKNATLPQDNAAIEFLLKLSRSFSATRPLTIFVTGAATDIASAILKDPSIVNRVSIVAMGFDNWPDGRDDFNVKNDPLAWQVILDSEVPVVVGSGSVARRGLKLTRTEAAALMKPHGPVGEYLYSILDDFMKKNPAMLAQYVAPETWVVWDEIVVAYALGMARGNAVPRPKLHPDLTFSHPETGRRITWLTEIDTGRFWRDLTQKIDAHRSRK
jgi:purine nucleosidase